MTSLIKILSLTLTVLIGSTGVSYPFGPEYGGNISILETRVLGDIKPYSSKFKKTNIISFDNRILSTRISNGMSERTLYNDRNFLFKYTSTGKTTDLKLEVLLNNNGQTIKINKLSIDGESFFKNTNNQEWFDKYSKLIDKKTLPAVKQFGVKTGTNFSTYTTDTSGEIFTFRRKALGLVNYQGHRAILIDIGGSSVTIKKMQLKIPITGYEIYLLDIGIMAVYKMLGYKNIKGKVFKFNTSYSISNLNVIQKSKPKPDIIAKKQPKQNPPTSPKKTPIYRAGSGSGFAITKTGYVVTNNHVINGCHKVRIHQKGVSVPATIVATDNLNDLALLKGKFKPIKIFKLSRTAPSLADEIYVVGYPFGKKISSSVKVTKGIVSSLTGVGNNYSNIQIDAAIQPGNSGGPIINQMGNVIGVAVARLDKIKILKELGSLPELTNFGIKSSVVLNLIQGNNIKIENPNQNTMKKKELVQVMSDATYYLSCWMTKAQIEKMRTKKVMFKDLK